jgi:hypothetical protein
VRLLKLDALVPDDKEIELGGKIFKAPGKITVRQVLEISKLGQQAGTDQDAMLDVLYKIWDIMAPLNPGLTKEDLIEQMTPAMVSPLITFLFGDNDGGPDQKN